MAVRSLQALAANRAAHLEDDRAIAQIPLVLQDRILARRFINSHGNYALVQALKERKIGLANQILLDETLPIQRLALMILQIDNEDFVDYQRRNILMDIVGFYDVTRPDFGNNILHTSSILGAQGLQIARNCLERLTFEQRINLITRRNRQGQTPLHLAAFFGNTEFIRLLLNSLPNELRNEYIYRLDNHEFTALAFAAKGNTLNAATALMEYLPVNLRSDYIRFNMRRTGHHVAERSFTALHVASAFGSIEMINFLIQSLAANEREEFIMRGNNKTALFFARNPAVVRALMEHLDLNQRSAFINHVYTMEIFTPERDSEYSHTDAEVTLWGYKAWDDITDENVIKAIISFLPENEKPSYLKQVFIFLHTTQKSNVVNLLIDVICCIERNLNRPLNYPSFPKSGLTQYSNFYGRRLDPGDIVL
jgi:hypothetical protein